MQCPRCQQENPPEAKFCLECGARLARGCPRCGTELPPGAKFCRECGERLAAPAPEAARFPSPETYTPRHLAEKILTSKSALEGERKQVTVLFADLKGSMELLADRDPEEARRLLDPVLERLMEAVHRYEGTVNQVMGDGIMALFGAPLAHEDHAVRACYAALRMQEAVGGYAGELRRSQGLDVQIRVGLNSGEVVVRSIGSDLHMDYTAVGQTTHLAARMEQLARPGTTLLTPATLRLAEGYVQVSPVGPVPVKGLAEPVEVFELAGAGPTRRRLEAALARGLTRFVGREAELEVLRQVLERAQAGHGQVVAIVGEAGVGKSRLLWEFTHSHRAHGWLILESSSASYGKATPYLPVIDLLKAYCQIEARDEARKIREKLTGKLLTLDRALEATLPALLALLEVPVDTAWQALDPPQRRQQTLDALKRLLLRESQVQPVLLVFEDLQWIDSETQAFLDTLVESLPTARLLLLVNYRPEYQHGWGSKTYYSQLRLDPLPPESAEELLQALLGTDPALKALKALLIARTEGNPFFLEESVRTLVEGQVLVGERGTYRLARPLAGIQVPATVQAILAARIDRLPAVEKHLLQAASAIGKDVPYPLLQAIADLPEDTLRHGLAHLQAAEFLYETNLFPELEYTFKHALTHEVAYGSLLQERRRVLHARIVAALERLYPDRIAEYAERLAHHASRGELWAQGLAYFRQAGAKALARSANQEALAYLEQALAALGHLPETRDTITQAIDIRFDLRRALWPLGEIRQALDYLREAETLAEGIGDQRRLCWVSAYMSVYSWITGDNDRAVTIGRRAVAIADGLDDFSLKVVATQYLGLAHVGAPNYRQAIDLLRRTVSVLEGDLARERFGQIIFPSVFSRARLAWCLTETGEFAEGAARAEEAVRIAEAVDQSVNLIEALAGLGAFHLRCGDAGRAITTLERGLSLCRLYHIKFWYILIASSLGLAYARSGRLAEALPLLEEAVELDMSMDVLMQRALRVAYLGEGYLLAGRTPEATHHAGQALDLARRQKERGHEAWVFRLLGEIAAHGDPPDPEAAETHYHEAMALAHELGMRLLSAHCHLGLGRLYHRTGNQPKAKEHLAMAATAFQEMTLPSWAEQATRALEDLG